MLVALSVGLIDIHLSDDMVLFSAVLAPGESRSLNIALVCLAILDALMALWRPFGLVAELANFCPLSGNERVISWPQISTMVHTTL